MEIVLDTGKRKSIQNVQIKQETLYKTNWEQKRNKHRTGHHNTELNKRRQVIWHTEQNQPQYKWLHQRKGRSGIWSRDKQLLLTNFCSVPGAFYEQVVSHLPSSWYSLTIRLNIERCFWVSSISVILMKRTNVETNRYDCTVVDIHMWSRHVWVWIVFDSWLLNNKLMPLWECLYYATEKVGLIFILCCRKG